MPSTIPPPPIPVSVCDSAVLPGKCPVCRGDIATQEITRCAGCDTGHHTDCWVFNGGCAIFGCVPAVARAATVPVPVAGSLASRGRQIAWLLFVIATPGALFVSVAMMGFHPLRRLLDTASDRLAQYVESQVAAQALQAAPQESHDR